MKKGYLSEEKSFDDCETAAYLRRILRTVSAGICVVVDRIIKEANPRFCDLFGYSSEEIVGRSSRFLYVSEIEYTYVGTEGYHRMAEFGVTTVEAHMLHKNGRVINTLMTLVPLERGDISRGVTFTVLDVTASKQAEVRLHESVEKYRNLVEQSIQGMVIAMDDPVRICFASKPMEAIVGYSSEELMGFSEEELFAIVHPDDQKSYFAVFDDRISGKLKQVRQEFRMIHKSGELRWVEIFGTTTLYEGHPATQTVMVDITERKQAEEALVKSGEKLRKLFDNIRDSLFVYAVYENGELGTFEMVNSSACRMFGYSRQQLLSMTPCDLYLSSVPSAFFAAQSEFSAWTESQMFETVLFHRDGSKIPAEVHAERTELSGKRCIIATVRDITTRKRAFEELKKISTALQQSHAVVVMTNALAEIEYVNPRFTELTGYSSAEVIGKNPRILQSGLVSKDVFDDLWETLKKDDVWKGEFLNKKKNGELYWENAVISSVKNEQGDIINYVAVKEDITEQKRLWNELVAAKEKAERCDRLKTAFLANMSHEIRTPMNGILGFSTLLKDPMLSDGKKEEYIELIRQSGNCMLNILNDLIDIAKIEAEELTIHYAPVSIKSVFHDLQAFFEPEVKRRGLYLHCTSEGCFFDHMIESDGIRLMQVLSNLVQNALKHTVSGGIELGCTEKRNMLEFYVKDTGVGIPDHFKERIFERFQRGLGGPGCNYEGAGLGLSISKSLVELLGGTIWFESSVGDGCVFFFTIPYKPLDMAPEVQEDLFARSVSRRFDRALCVLIAEDDKISRLLLEKVFDDSGIDVISVLDGCQAVQAVKCHPDIDIVIMDIFMPDMDGYEALTEIKRVVPGLPVIAHTAFVSPEDERKALKAGFDAFLTKPVNVEKLFDLIQRFTA